MELLVIGAAALWLIALLSAAVVYESARSWRWVSGPDSAAGCAMLYVLLGPASVLGIVTAWVFVMVLAMLTFLWDLLTVVVNGVD
jgi:hypothetical protein